MSKTKILNTNCQYTHNLSYLVYGGNFDNSEDLIYECEK